MKYMGSKKRIAKFILPIMLAEAEKNRLTTWVEPFVGGANMIDKVPDTFERVGYDLNEHVIHALIDIRDNADSLPDEVSEEYFRSLIDTPAKSITSWVRCACAYSGRFGNGYARQGKNPRYKKTIAQEGKNNALKQSPKIQNVQFICDSYENLDFENCLIYCDPPYEGTTSYKTGAFDHTKFWNWCRKMSEKNLVFVSEYKAPDDFECIWQGEVKTNFASNRKEATHKAVEKLFRYKLSPML